MQPSSSLIFAPSRLSPSRWMSVGRAPILHPPGACIRASPVRTSMGASMNTDERMAPASSAGVSEPRQPPHTVMLLPSLVTAQPSAPSMVAISSTSVIRGQSVSVTGSSDSIPAASMGRTAFLAPWTVTSPKSFLPPRTTRRASLSLFKLFLLALLRRERRGALSA